MDYPRDCIDRLLQEMKRNEPEDEPGSKYAEHNSRVRQRCFPHPERTQLEQILDVAHAASLQPEEGRLPQFALAFVPPKGLDPKFQPCPFKAPKPFRPDVIAKLAPAATPNRTYLGVSSTPAEGGLGIWGLIHSNKGPLSTEPEDGRGTYRWKEPFLLVRVFGPGVIFVFHWHRLLLVYARGEPHWGLSAARLQSILRERASMEGDAAETLCQVVGRMVLLGKGGTILITESATNVSSDLLDLSYRFEEPNTVLKGCLADGHEKTTPPLRLALDFVAQLSAVDGVVHVASDLSVVGFGGKVMALQPPEGATFIKEDANSTAEAGEGPTSPFGLSEISGMRHRSAALFCARQPGQALAIVVSQDGDVTLFGRQPDGAVRRIGPYALGVGLAVL